MHDNFLKFHTGSTFMFRQWNEYWVKMAEKTDKMIYFFRFEDVL